MAELAGRVAVMRRGGGINFVTKIERAQAAGAIGVIMINSDQDTDGRRNSGDEIFTMGGDDFTNIKIPSLMIKFSDEALVLGKKGLTASLSIRTGTGCPLQSRFYTKVPEAEIEAVLVESSLYTEEELADQQEKKKDEMILDEINSVLRQLSAVMDGGIIREVHAGVRGQPPAEQLAALQNFAQSSNIDLKDAQESKQVASAEGEVLKKDIAAALVQLNDVMGAEMVQEIHHSIQRMPLKDQLQALTNFGVPLDLPSAQEPKPEPEPVPEPEPELGRDDPIPELESEPELEKAVRRVVSDACRPSLLANWVEEMEAIEREQLEVHLGGKTVTELLQGFLVMDTETLQCGIDGMEVRTR